MKNMGSSSDYIMQKWLSIGPLLAGSIVLLLAIYRQTLSSMILTWWNIGTYTHGFVIFPTSLWLIWTNRNSISCIAPKPALLAIFALLAVTLIWLIANLGGLIGVQQFALISLIQLLTLTLLGTEIYRKLLFPLLFLYLSVPFGDFLISPMMELTADFTVLLLKFSGIPVYRNGLYFMLPSGQWSVVAACSGVRYLIASITVGVLFAYFCYSSLYKRLIFTVASIIVPVIANSLRAYIIVLIGHYSNMTLATGVDHFIYGWLFFGVIIAIMLWIGTLFQDPAKPNNHDKTHSLANLDSSTHQQNTLLPEHLNNKKRSVTITCLALATCAIGPVSAYFLNQKPQHTINLNSIMLPQSQASWKLIEGIDIWQPGYTGQSLQLSSLYQSQSGRVQLTMIFYPNESQGHELINGQNSLFPNNVSNWHLISESSKQIKLPQKINLRESVIANKQYQLIWQFNWINGQYLISDSKAKMIAVKNRLLGSRNNTVAIMLNTETGEEIIDAQQRLSDFLKPMSALIFQTINQFDRLTREKSTH